ncbi:MAG: hypothetical protein AB1607_04270 [Chloroflexota bacterium]
MNEEEKKWQEQYAKNSTGNREIFRLGCVLVIWYAIGVGLTIWSGNVGYVLICFAAYLSFPALTGYWQPAYALSRKILGNESLPPSLMPRKFKWWNYLPLAIRLAISAALLFKGVEFLVR